MTKRKRRKTLVSKNTIAGRLPRSSGGRPGVLRGLFVLLLAVALGGVLWKKLPLLGHWAVTTMHAPWEKIRIHEQTHQTAKITGLSKDLKMRMEGILKSGSPEEVKKAVSFMSEVKIVSVNRSSGKTVEVIAEERRPIAFVGGAQVMGVDRDGVIFPLKRGIFLNLPFVTPSDHPLEGGDTLRNADYALRVLDALSRQSLTLFNGLAEVSTEDNSRAELLWEDARRVRIEGDDISGALDHLRRVLVEPGLFQSGILYVGYKNVAFIIQEEG